MTTTAAMEEAVPAHRGGRVAPGPRGRGLGGSLGDFRDGKIGFLMGLGPRYGEVVRFRFGPKTIHLLRHPDHLKAVLHDGYLEVEKASRGFTKLKALLGNGLVTSDGADWQRQRRIAQPAFHARRTAAFAGRMTAVAEETAERWEPHAASGRPLDVYPEMSRLTLEVVVRTLLGSDLPPGAFDTVNRGLAVALEHMNRNIYRLLDVPPGLPTRHNRRFRRAVAAMDELVYGLIAARRRDAGGRDDVLSMLVEARDEETGEGLADGQLRDQVMTVLLAGHETTAIALTWCWMLLAVYPEAGRRLRRELAERLGERPATADDVAALPFTTAVIQEALRLYPPLWAFSRRVRRPMEIGGFAIPGGSTLFISPYVTHRHPGYWRDPEAFDPDRWLDGSDPTRRTKFAFLPFGAGPRHCIGGGFAVLEMQLVLAALARRFHLELAPGRRPEPNPLLTLRPAGGLTVTLHRAEGA
jgi:cytochrome P450